MAVVDQGGLVSKTARVLDVDTGRAGAWEPEPHDLDAVQEAAGRHVGSPQQLPRRQPPARLERRPTTRTQPQE